MTNALTEAAERVQVIRVDYRTPDGELVAQTLTLEVDDQQVACLGYSENNRREIRRMERVAINALAKNPQAEINWKKLPVLTTPWGVIHHG